MENNDKKTPQKESAPKEAKSFFKKILDFLIAPFKRHENIFNKGSQYGFKYYKGD